MSGLFGGLKTEASGGMAIEVRSQRWVEKGPMLGGGRTYDMRCFLAKKQPMPFIRCLPSARSIRAKLKVGT